MPGAAQTPETTVRHLYAHIPFCPKICPYCSFYKEPARNNKSPGFVRALLAEARSFAGILEPETIFFGGGTPTALPTKQIEELLHGVRGLLPLQGLQEWTFEMNPATVSLEKARILLDCGVNRASMGVQAWQPEVLATLGRVHSAGQAERSFAILRQAGFENINIDLIFGVPGQTRAQWVETLEKSVALSPEHISAYCLTYEEDTAFFDSLGAGIFLPDEEKEAWMFERAYDFLEAAGYRGYEISNFAKPGFECRHNLAYWAGEDYLGLGPSAFSTVGTTRWRNIPDTSTYTRRLLEGRTARDFEEALDEPTKLREKIAFGLRTASGVPGTLLPKEVAAGLLARGVLEVCGGNYRLAKNARIVADAVAAELLPG